jgi:hypothetical protein
MQKVLTEMNVQLANVISDISGVTGMAIIQAILDGERDRYKLPDLADVRIQATREEIARSLEGNWRKESIPPSRLGSELYIGNGKSASLAESGTEIPIQDPGAFAGTYAFYLRSTRPCGLELSINSAHAVLQASSCG